MKIKTITFIIMTALLQAAAETNSVRRSCCLPDVRPAAFSDKSLYQVESKWTTDTGKEIKLGALAGRPQVVLMFFSRCTAACPILANDLRRIEAALTPTERASVSFTLVSFDSNRDTPVALSEYRKAWSLPENWSLLNGDSDDVLELAALLGVQFKREADGQFVHSNVITLLNSNGEIVFQKSGLDSDLQEMIHQIEHLVSVRK